MKSKIYTSYDRVEKEIENSVDTECEMPQIFVSQYKLDGTFVKDWYLVEDIIRKYDVVDNDILLCIYGIKLAAAGFIFVFEDESAQIMTKMTVQYKVNALKKYAIRAYNFKTHKYYMFSTIRQAYEASGINEEELMSHCRYNDIYQGWTFYIP